MNQFNLEQLNNEYEGSPTCANCHDAFYMDNVHDGLYRCPVCGDELDMWYIVSPFDDYEMDLDDVYPDAD